MNFEQIKDKLIEYINSKNITYLRKSNLADFAIVNGFEIEDINNIFEDSYNSNFTIFYEKINGTKYRRYILGHLDYTEIQTKTNLKYCSYCNCFSSNAISAIDGTTFCDINCAKYYSYDYCDKCGELEKITYCDADIKLCKKCLERHASDYNLTKCSRCHKYFSKTTLYEIGEQHLCRNCTYRIDTGLTGYHGHDKNKWKLFKNNREKITNTFGFENEMEIKGDTPCNVLIYAMETLLEEQGIKDFYTYENDGSLVNGFEAITEPFTLKWLYENEGKLQIVYDYLIKNNCTGEKCSTAGLHIHFNRKMLAKTDSLAKIAFMINNLQYDFVKFSGRKVNQLDYTCFDRLYNNENEILLKDYKRKYQNQNQYNTTHSAVVNTQHANTIEIRLFKGTIDLKRIIANVELVNNLVYYAENHSDTDVENVTFKELCLFKKTRYLKQYYFKIFEPNIKLKEVA